jgi:glycerol-3-phosphate dehydrogenase
MERRIMMTATAPHLVRAMPMLLPLTPSVTTGQGYLAAAGLRAGDVMRSAARTPRDLLPRTRRLSPTETLHLARGVRGEALRGALLSWDGQLEDDARLVVALARTAAQHGARVLTRCRVRELHGDGAVVRDELTGAISTIKARAVINAAGVWAAQLVPGVNLRPSRGSHLSCAREPGNPSVALTAPSRAGESLRLRAQPDGLVRGLTDEPADGDIPDVATATEAEIRFLLDVISGVLETPLRPTMSWAVRRAASAARGRRQHSRPLPQARGTDITRRGGHGRRRQAHHLPPDG